MESTKTCITASASQQVGKPSRLDRLLYSSWYLEARVVVSRFAAHHAALVQRLENLIKAGVR